MVRKLAVATAINEEFKLLRSTLKQVQKECQPDRDGYKSCSGRVDSGEIDLALTYMGPAASRAVAEKWLSKEKHFGLIVIGYCGGLSLPLKVGDVVIPSSLKFLSDEPQTDIVLDEKLNEDIGKTLMSIGIRYRNVPLLTTRKVIQTPSEREILFKKTGAEAVDMESYGLVDVAKKKGVPCAVIRVVCDDSETELPDFNSQIKADERIESYQLSKALLAHPKLTLSLKKNMSRADDSLLTLLPEIFPLIIQKWKD